MAMIDRTKEKKKRRGRRVFQILPGKFIRGLGLQHITSERRREITSCPWQSPAPRDTTAPCITTRSDGETEKKEGGEREGGRETVGGRDAA